MTAAQKGRRIRMMALFRRNKQTVGIDIGSGLVKAAVIDHSGSEPRLVRLGALPLAVDTIVEGEIMDPPAVVDTVQALMQTLEVRGRGVVTAVGGRDVIVKKIRMDRMPATDAREVISWEAEQYVPFDTQNVRLDFQILDPAAEGVQMSVLLVAAKKELVEQRVQLLSDAGLNARVVDVDAFALYNAFEYNYPAASKGLAALVNVGHEVTTIIVQQDGVPIVSREVPFGTKRLREDLRRMHGLSADEAEQVLRGKGRRDPEVDRLLSDRGGELALAIERATTYLDVDGPSMTPLGGIYLAGGAANVPRLKEAIADRLRTRTEVVNPLQRLDIAPEAMADLPDDQSAGMWMLPVGLALRAPA
jgi:type IV pilus assembly protein PilM